MTSEMIAIPSLQGDETFYGDDKRGEKNDQKGPFINGRPHRLWGETFGLQEMAFKEIEKRRASRALTDHAQPLSSTSQGTISDGKVEKVGLDEIEDIERGEADEQHSTQFDGVQDHHMQKRICLDWNEERVFSYETAAWQKGKEKEGVENGIISQKDCKLQRDDQDDDDQEKEENHFQNVQNAEGPPKPSLKAFKSPGSRRYLVSSHVDFWNKYKKLDEDSRHYYELIQEGKACKLYFDIEFQKSLNPLLDGLSSINLFLQLLYQDLFDTFGVSDPQKEVVDLNASTSEKFSHHLILSPSFIFKNNSDMGLYVKHFILQLYIKLKPEHDAMFLEKSQNSETSRFSLLFPLDSQNQHRPIIDTSVYTKNRNFRLFLSSKMGKKAPFKIGELDSAFLLSGSIDVYFLKSLVCFIPYSTTMADILSFEKQAIAKYSHNPFGGPFFNLPPFLKVKVPTSTLLSIPSSANMQMMLKNSAQDASSSSLEHPLHQNQDQDQSSNFPVHSSYEIVQGTGPSPFPDLDRFIASQISFHWPPSHYRRSKRRNSTNPLDVDLSNIEEEGSKPSLFGNVDLQVQSSLSGDDDDQNASKMSDGEIENWRPHLMRDRVNLSILRSWRLTSQTETMVYNISGSNKWCEVVKREHKGNHIYVVVNLKKRFWIQLCHDQDCRSLSIAPSRFHIPPFINLPGFSSAYDVIVDEEALSSFDPDYIAFHHSSSTNHDPIIDTESHQHPNRASQHPHNGDDEILSKSHLSASSSHTTNQNPISASDAGRSSFQSVAEVNRKKRKREEEERVSMPTTQLETDDLSEFLHIHHQDQNRYQEDDIDGGSTEMDQLDVSLANFDPDSFLLTQQKELQNNELDESLHDFDPDSFVQSKRKEPEEGEEEGGGGGDSSKDSSKEVKEAKESPQSLGIPPSSLDDPLDVSLHDFDPDSFIKY
jgi:hypothetical protein